MAAPSDDADKFMLRLPDGMRDEIANTAAANGRSMNAEIVHRLRYHQPTKLRDQFAGQIITGMYASMTDNDAGWPGPDGAAKLAHVAYRQAAAMIAERNGDIL